MALLKKFKTNVKEDDLDLDFDMSFDSFGEDKSVSEKSRTPVSRAFKGAIKGAEERIVNPELLKKTARNALPKEYGEVYDHASSIIGVVPTLYDEAVKEIKPAMQSTVRNINKLVPSEMKRTRKLMDRISEIVGLPNDNKNAFRRDKEIEDNLSSIFLQQAKTYSEDRAEDKAREDIKENLEAKRAKNELQLLNSINVGVRSLSSYNERITAAYQRKSLELQYRSYYTQVDLLNTTKEYYNVFKNQFTGIEHNTSLPDFVKTKKSEQFKDLARNRFFNSIQNSLFGNNDFVSKGIENIKKAAKDKIGSISDLLSMMEMSTNMAVDAKETQESFMSSGFMDAGPKKTKAEHVAGFLGGEASDTLAGYLGQAINKRLTKPGSKLQKYGFKGLKYASDIPAALKDLRKSGIVDVDYGASGVGGFVKNSLKSGLSGILDIFASSLNPETKLEKQSSLLVENLPTAFTNQTQKSIVSVIPGYLSRIYREIQVLRTGDESTPMTEYDLRSDKFQTRKQMVKSTSNFLKKEMQQFDYSDTLDKSVNTIIGGKKIPRHVKEGLKTVLHNANFSDQAGVIDVDTLLDDRNYENIDPSVARKIKAILQRNYNKKSDDFERKDLELSKSTRELRQSMGDVRGYIQSLLNSGQEDVLKEIGIVKEDEYGNTVIDMKRYKEMSLESQENNSDNLSKLFGTSKPFSYSPKVSEGADTYGSQNEQFSELISALSGRLSPASQDNESLGDDESIKETLISISTNVIDIRKLLEERKNATYEPGSGKRDIIDVGESLFTKVGSGLQYARDSLFPKLKDKATSLGQAALEKGEKAKDYITNLDEAQLDELGSQAKTKASELKEKGHNAKKGLLGWLDRTGISRKASGLTDAALEKGEKAKDDITKSKGYRKVVDYLFGKKTPKEPGDLAKDIKEITQESDTEGENTDVGFLSQLMRFKNTQMEKAGNFYKDFKKGFKEGYDDAQKAKAAYNDTNKDGERDGSWRQLLKKRTGFTGELAGKAEAQYRSKTNVIDSMFSGVKSLFDRMRGNVSDLGDVLDAGSDALASGGKKTSKLGGLLGKLKDYGAARGGKLGKAASMLGSVGQGALNIGGRIFGAGSDLVPESFAGSVLDKTRAMDKAVFTRGPGLIKDGIIGTATAGANVMRGAKNILTSEGFKKGAGAVLGRTRSLDKTIVSGGYNLAKQGLKLGAKGAWGLTKFAGKAALGIGSEVLLPGAGAVLGGMGTAFMAALPVGIAALGLFGAYKGYKYLTRNKASDLTKVRLLQYGLSERDKDQYYRVFELESIIEENALGFGPSGAYFMQKAMDQDLASEIYEIFEIDPSDQEKQMIFNEWFTNRFIPVFIKHENALHNVNKKYDIDEVDKLADDEKKTYLDTIGVSDDVFNVTTSPFPGIDQLSTTNYDVKSAIAALSGDLKKDIPQTGRHQLVAVDSNIKSSVVQAGVIPPISMIKDPLLKQVLASKANPTNASFSDYLKWSGMAIVQPITKLFHHNVTALEAVRFKTYGLADMERSKVSSLRNLEDYVSKLVSIDGNEQPVFDGEVIDVIHAQGTNFGLSSRNDPNAPEWTKWFKDRFLPVFLTYIGTGYQYTKKKDPIAIENDLKDTDKYDVATKVSGVSDVWDIKAAPWINTVINTDSKTVDKNLNYLRDRSKDKVLNQQSQVMSAKTEQQKRLQEKFDYSETSDGKFLSKLWGGAKDLASAAWDKTKEYAGKAWDHAFNTNQADEFRILKNAGDAATSTQNLEKSEQEADDTTKTSSGGYSEGGKGMVPVDEQQGHSTRRLPITGKLKAILARAGGAAGIDKVIVFSGGQPATGPNRVGSHRHDYGNAADIRLIKDGRHLSHLSPNDLPYYKSFAKTAASLGATGIGAGPGYMGPTAMHVGFGPKITWGRGGRSANAPQWLREAVGEGWKSNGNIDAFKIMDDAANTAKGIGKVTKPSSNTSGASGSWDQTPQGMGGGGGATGAWDAPAGKLEKGEKEPKDSGVADNKKNKTYYGYYKPHGISSGILSNPEWVEKMRAAEAKYGIPFGTLQAIAAKESTGNPNAKSKADKSGKRGWGLGQFRNATAQHVTKVTGIPIWQNGQVNMDPNVQIEAMAALLSLKKKAVGSIMKQPASWDDAIWAYNAGEGTVANVKRGRGYGSMPADPNYLKEVKANRDAINGGSSGGSANTVSSQNDSFAQNAESSATPASGTSQPLPGQAFRSWNVPDNAGVTPTLPQNNGMMQTSFATTGYENLSGLTGPIKPNVMAVSPDPRAPQVDKGSGFEFGGIQSTTKNIDDTLTKSLDVQTQMLQVLKTMAEKMSPESFSKMIKGMVPVADKPKMPPPKSTKAGSLGKDTMPKPAVSLARTIV